MLKTKLFFIILALSFTSKSYANERNLKIEYLSPIALSISEKGINRIKLPFRATKIIGDSNSYKVQASGNQLFLVSKLPAGEVINLSVIMNTGSSLDLKLNVGLQKNPSLIDFNNASSKVHNAFAERELVLDMIVQMASKTNERDKYYVSHYSKPEKIVLDSGVTLNTKTTYSYQNLQGIVFEATSKSKGIIHSITTKDIASSFKNIIAVSMKDEEIYLVLQKGDQNA